MDKLKDNMFVYIIQNNGQIQRKYNHFEIFSFQEKKKRNCCKLKM